MRILAVDPGAARVGLALSDETETLATPHGILPGSSRVEREVARVAAEVGAERVVVGLPRNMDGSEGAAAAAARELADRIEAASGLAVVLWDERLTSRVARRQPEQWLKPDRRGHRAPGRGPARGREADDARAAAEILQSFLDRNREVHP